MARNKVPTMSDVAKLAGVSPMTVSRALRPDAPVSGRTRLTILQAADQLGYVLDSSASGLSSRKTGFVAVTIPSINNVNFANTVRGLSDGLRETGYEVLLGFTDYKLEEEERLVEAFLRRRPEAIVVTGGVHSERCRRYLAASGVPVIEIWDLPTAPIEYSVGFSNHRVGRVMAEHLIAQGHQKLAFIGGNAKFDIRGADRRKGFLDVLEEHDLDTRRMMAFDFPILDIGGGGEAMNALLAAHPDTQAVMCVSDLSAFGAMMACVRRGLTVPTDIAIAGFGAHDLAANAVPQITTLDVDDYRIGQEAACVINGALGALGNNQSEHNPQQCIEIPFRLIERESSATPSP